jgi:hypothetical protein
MGRWLMLFFGGLGLLSTGCQQWPGTQAMRQYQLESDRLLSEFRTQKKRAEELAARNQQLEQRLGESEKMIARLQGSGNSRFADAPSRSKALAGDRNSQDPNSGESTRRLPGPGLPDATANPIGRLTSGPYNGGSDLRGDPSRSQQWRPIPGR